MKLRTSSTSEADETNVQRGVALDTHLSSALLWKVCWGGHQIVASGCSNGAISVWDLEVMFEGKTINSETIHSSK